MSEARLSIAILSVFFSALIVVHCEAQTNNQGSLHQESHSQQLNRKVISHSQTHLRPETQQTTETLERKQTYIQPIVRDKQIRVTLSEPTARHLKLDSLLNTLDRIAYIISKPAAIINALKFVSIAVTSLVMSIFMLPGLGSASLTKRRYRGRTHDPFRHSNSFFGALSRTDLEGMIELMANNYDETLNQAGFNDRSPCRERALCMFGDMMACDFPNIIISIGRFAQNHLPPVDMNKNKYTKAIILGLNQTDCESVYKTNFYDCPSFRDYVRSYFHSGFKRRRDHHAWWRN